MRTVVSGDHFPAGGPGRPRQRTHLCEKSPLKAIPRQPCSAVPRYALPRSIAWDSTAKHNVALRSMAKRSVSQHSMHGVVNDGQSRLTSIAMRTATIGSLWAGSALFEAPVEPHGAQRILNQPKEERSGQPEKFTIGLW